MSPRMLRTTAALPTETLELERFAGLDGQGLPSYDSPVDFEANITEYDITRFAQGRAFVVAADGSRIETPLNLWVRGTSDVVPDEQDRVIRDGAPFIVAERRTVSGLWRRAAEPDHYHYRLRRE